jgi:hypothetical protein
VAIRDRDDVVVERARSNRGVALPDHQCACGIESVPAGDGVACRAVLARGETAGMAFAVNEDLYRRAAGWGHEPHEVGRPLVAERRGQGLMNAEEARVVKGKT